MNSVNSGRSINGPAAVPLPVPVPVPPADAEAEAGAGASRPNITFPEDSRRVRLLTQLLPHIQRIRDDWALVHKWTYKGLEMVQLSVKNPSRSRDLLAGPEMEEDFLKAALYLKSSADHRQGLAPFYNRIIGQRHTNQLRDVVNEIKMSVGESEDVTLKFGNSNLSYFVQMVDSIYIGCPWSTQSKSKMTSLAMALQSLLQSGEGLSSSSTPQKRKVAGDRDSIAVLYPAPKRFRDVFSTPGIDPDADADAAVGDGDGSDSGPPTQKTNPKNAVVSGAFKVNKFIQIKKFHLFKELLWTLNIMGSSIQDFDVDPVPVPVMKENNGRRIHSKLTTFGVHLTDEASMNKKNSHFHVRTALLSKILMDILESSSNTLTKFHVLSPLAIFPRLKIPPLPKVDEILLGNKGFSTTATATATASATRSRSRSRSRKLQKSEPYFPPGIILGETFPNLTKISMNFENMDKHKKWEDYFGFRAESQNQSQSQSQSQPPLLTVTTLTINENCGYLPLGWVTKFAGLCPNVASFNVDTAFYNFPDAAEGMWRFLKLKSLSLKIDLWAVENIYYGIDSAFTGFSGETCYRLSQGGLGPGQERVRPSIIALKELERLKVTFVDVTPKKTRIHEIFTKVTGQYCFRSLPQLKVCLEAEGKTPKGSMNLLKVLSPLHPFAHIHLPALNPTHTSQ